MLTFIMKIVRWRTFFLSEGSHFKRTAIVIKEKNSMQVAGLSVKITKEDDSSVQCCTFLCFMTGYSGRTFWQLHPIWYIHEFSHSMSGDILDNLQHLLFWSTFKVEDKHLSAKVSLIHQLETFDVGSYLAMTSVAI